MNKIVTSYWKSLFFRHNIRKIRKALMEYLSGEGIKSQLVDGGIHVALEENVYRIDFDLEGEYPRCIISYQVANEDYQALQLSQKTFIADKVNTDEERLSTVRAFNDSIGIDTYFYFTNRRMLLILFYKHFTDLKTVVEATMEQAIEAIQEKESKRPIGFSVAQIEYSKNEETEISASTTANN